MSETSATSPVVAIDASLATRMVLPAPSSVDVAQRLAEWQRGRIRVVSSMLWLAEGVSALRKAVFARAITSAESRDALEDLLRLEVETVAIDADQCRSALRWADRLGQSRADDGFDVALAEAWGVPLWTADKRLANAARQAGIAWVHSIG